MPEKELKKKKKPFFVFFVFFFFFTFSPTLVGFFFLRHKSVQKRDIYIP